MKNSVSLLEMIYTKPLDSPDAPYDYDHYAVDFSKKDSQLFTDHFLVSEYVRMEELQKSLSENRSRLYVIRFILQDNSSFHVIYYPEDNAFNRGYGDDVIKELVEQYAGRAQMVPRPPNQ